MCARQLSRISQSRRRLMRRSRRGVLLLIVLALLALLTLMGLTLVVATSQGRLSAVSAARANAEATRDDAAVGEVINQVLRGTNDPDSPLQGHGLLEDLYGSPQLFGLLNGSVTTVAGGQLINMDITSATGYALAPWNGAYCGQVITMLDGPAQGYSARVVGYIYNGGTSATIQVTSFNGLVPTPANANGYIGDQFMINGRPFSGTGSGFDLTNAKDATGNLQLNTSMTPPTVLTAPYSQSAATGPLLTASEVTSSMSNKPGPTGMPYAYLPNHAQIQLAQNGVTPFYTDVNGPGGANESYDAVDFQNMLLAMHMYVAPNTNVLTPNNGVITPIPSLHRPEIVAWHAYQYLQSNGISAVPQNIRRKVILRPEPMDQAFSPAVHDVSPGIAGQWDFREPWVDKDASQAYTAGEPFLDLNGDGAWTAGDKDYSGNQFNPITGCWYIDATDPANIVWRRDPNVIGGLDVDNDNDGIPDSIWIDAGLPVQTLPDGTEYKSLTGILCIDMDGKINLNAHGTIAQLDPNRYANTAETLNPIYGPFANIVAGAPLLGPLPPEFPTGTRDIPIGQGYGAAEINPAYLLSKIAGGGTISAPTLNAATLNYYANLLMGYAFYNSSTTPPTFVYSVDGKYGESSRYPNSTYPGVYPPTNGNSPLPGVFMQYLLGGPRPGWSRWIDPWMTNLTGFDWVNDPVALARMPDVRPFLLNPTLQLLPAPPNVTSSYRFGRYFDFVAPSMQPNVTSAPYSNPLVHVPTSHGSPYDLLARGVVATDLRGAPYYAGTQRLPWMSSYYDTPSGQYLFLQDQDPALSTTPMGPYQDAYLSYLNDAIDSPYELDLSPNAQHAGRITGGVGGSSATPSEAPFTPSELESILRVNDPDAKDLRKRVDQLQTVYDNAAAPQNPLPAANPSKLTDDSVRLSLTTEGWDLPVPSISLTPQQMQDIATFNNRFVLNGPQLNLNGLSLSDLARARIFAENTGYTVANAADLSLFGNPSVAVWPLLAPEVVMGMRLDINRLLGNGQDDNGNGVVDEPAEVFWRDPNNGSLPRGEYLAYPQAKPNTTLPPMFGAYLNKNVTLEWLDLNNDGFLPTDNLMGASVLLDPQTGNTVSLSEPTYADMRARQLLARQLYVTMMLLLDNRIYQKAQAFQTGVNQLPTPWPQVSSLMPQDQAAYVVAQWAINAVDFRDRDSIITPFEFDLHPFTDDDGNPANGTWDVDDIVDPAVGGPVPGSKLDDQNVLYNNALTPIRGLVWGCERPELLLTETIATHDRGTNDTTNAAPLANSMPDTLQQTPQPPVPMPDPNQDQTYDQVRRPKGSLLVEVFNPNSPLDAPQFDMLQAGITTAGYVPANGVNLTQRVQLPGQSVASAVWRIAVTYSSQYDSNSFYTSMPAGMQQLDPRVPVLPSTYIHSVAYFAPLNPDVTTASVGSPVNAAILDKAPLGQAFYVDSNLVPITTNVIVPPSSYALIGPGSANGGAAATYFGERSGGGSTGYPAAVNYGAGGYLAQFVNPSAGLPGTPMGPYQPTGLLPNIKPVAGLPIATLSLDGAGAPTSLPPTTTLRFSISEPEKGYPVKTTVGGSNWDDDLYQSPYPNIPFDDKYNTENTNIKPNTNVAPKAATQINNIENYTTVYLQRLANPLAPWDAYANPYITVDSMPVDLTAYTGEANGATEPQYYDTNGKNPVAPQSTTTGKFDARQRGDATDTSTADAPNLWSSKTTAPSALAAGSTLDLPLSKSTPGYLNQPYWWDPTPVGGIPPTTAPTTWQTAFYSPANTTWYTKLATFFADPLHIQATDFNGDPLAPFPWMTWLNRPYVSQYELMLVPASSPSSLCSDFGMLGWKTGASLNQYQPGSPAGTGQLPVAQFEHLLNFYDSQQPLAAGVGTFLPNLYRIFEHVHVPSRFTGTQSMLSPYQFDSNNAGSPHLFHTPFNWLSSYREPGRMNLNTVFDTQVFEGLMDAYPGWGTLWAQLVSSRQGTTTTNITVLPNWQLFWNTNSSGNATNTVYPSFFANPFRPDGAGALVPQTSVANPLVSGLLHPWTYPGVAYPLTTNPLYNGINATLLRANLANSYPGGSAPVMATASLLDNGNFDPNNPAATSNFKLSSSTTQYRHAGRNAYFQYQALQRLGNLATTRSNVYAVWITLGNFKVQRVPISNTNPDGYQLVEEIGVSTGQVERKRAFYLIDRSIPVGFKRGENLNVERTILLERILDD